MKEDIVIFFLLVGTELSQNKNIQVTYGQTYFNLLYFSYCRTVLLTQIQTDGFLITKWLKGVPIPAYEDS